MRTIVLNQSNVVPDGNNNTLVYRFPSNATFKDNMIALQSLSMYYSWFNITAAFGNNKLTFNWVNAAGTNNYTTYTITIPDGLYEITDLNEYLQFVFFNANSLTTSQISPVPAAPFYLTDAAGDRVYYVQLSVNANRYSVQLDTYNVPTSLPVGWTNTGGTLLPLQTFNPVVTFQADFNKIVGFPTTFISAQNQNNASPNPNTPTAYKIGSTFSYISTLSPQVQPNPTLLLTISNVSNDWGTPSGTIYGITPSVAIGKQIVEKPPEYAWQPLMDSQSVPQLRLQLLTVTGETVQLRDPNMCILLVIK
jgi:hypothetical protein